MIQSAGEAAELGFKAHPHMLRHACGFALANKGHDTRALQAYLGHRTSSTRFDTPSCHPIGSRISGAERRSTPRKRRASQTDGYALTRVSKKPTWWR